VCLVLLHVARWLCWAHAERWPIMFV